MISGESLPIRLELRSAGAAPNPGSIGAGYIPDWLTAAAEAVIRFITGALRSVPKPKCEFGNANMRLRAIENLTSTEFLLWPD